MPMAGTGRTGRLRWGPLVAAASIPAVAAVCRALPPCLPLGCDGVSVATGSGFELPSPDEFVPDRRPAVMVNLFGGSCINPPSGGPDGWIDNGDANGNDVPDSVDWLLERLDVRYAEGWRRIILYLPAGAYAGQYLASSQWWPMPEIKRIYLTQRLPLWLAAHPTVSLGIYAGFEIKDPCTLCMVSCVTCADCGSGGGCDFCPECQGVSLARAPDTTDAEDMCVVRHNLEPWINAGITEVWFDRGGGPDPAHYEATMRLEGDPDYRGRVRFAGEPVVSHSPDGAAKLPLESAVTRLTWLARRRYLENASATAPPGAWDFDPQTTEVIAWFRSDDFCVDAVGGDFDDCTECPSWCHGVPDTDPIDVVADYVDRGYVALARGPAEEYVRRIFNINPGSLPCPADLDADGDVDVMDTLRVLNNYGTPEGATIYRGDVDLDGDVDWDDFMAVLGHEHYNGPCP